MGIKLAAGSQKAVGDLQGSNSASFTAPSTSTSMTMTAAPTQHSPLRDINTSSSSFKEERDGSSSQTASACNDTASPSDIQDNFQGDPELALLPTVDPFCSRASCVQLGRFLGPGFMIAMAYLDPGNLSADINQGVAAGYSLAWVTLWATVIGFIIQCLAAKLGVATGRNLAEHCRACYPPFPRYSLLVITELGIVACDMIEVVGGAVALNTLSKGAIPLYGGVLITVVAGFGALCLERWGIRLLEAFLSVLILVMGGAFSYLFFSTGVDYAAMAKGLVIPHLSSETISFAISALGALIMPHNLFLHSALVLTRRNLPQGPTPLHSMRYVKIEAGLVLALAFGINVFVVGVFANAFYNGSTVNAAAVGLGNAGAELALLYGAAMRYVWGVGLFAAAIASTVTSTYAGQVVLSGFLGIITSKWWSISLVRATALGPTLLLVALPSSGNDASMTQLTEWLNIVQSLVLPFVVIPLLQFTSSVRIMGSAVNSKFVVVSMGGVLAFLIGMNCYVALSFGLDQIADVVWAKALFGSACAVYGLFVLYFVAGPRRVSRGVKAVAARAKPAMDRAVDMVEL